MSTFDKEMQKALESDGEKLRQLTGQDHGPVWGTIAYCQFCHCETWHFAGECEWSDGHALGQSAESTK